MIALAPDKNMNVYYLLGKNYENMENYTEAIQFYSKVLDEDSNDMKTLISIGACYEALGDTLNAEKYFVDAVNAEPNNAVALNYLGYFYADRNMKLKEIVEEPELRSSQLLIP